MTNLLPGLRMLALDDGATGEESHVPAGTVLPDTKHRPAHCAPPFFMGRSRLVMWLEVVCVHVQPVAPMYKALMSSAEWPNGFPAP